MPWDLDLKIVDARGPAVRYRPAAAHVSTRGPTLRPGFVAAHLGRSRRLFARREPEGRGYLGLGAVCIDGSGSVQWNVGKLLALADRLARECAGVVTVAGQEQLVVFASGGFGPSRRIPDDAKRAYYDASNEGDDAPALRVTAALAPARGQRLWISDGQVWERVHRAVNGQTYRASRYCGADVARELAAGSWQWALPPGLDTKQALHTVTEHPRLRPLLPWHAPAATAWLARLWDTL